MQYMLICSRAIWFFFFFFLIDKEEISLKTKKGSQKAT